MAKSTLHGSDLARPAGRATYQDVLDAPAHRVAEIIDGTLHLSPRPVPLQALASGTLHLTLAAPSLSIDLPTGPSTAIMQRN